MPGYHCIIQGSWRLQVCEIYWRLNSPIGCLTNTDYSMSCLPCLLVQVNGACLSSLMVWRHAFVLAFQDTSWMFCFASCFISYSWNFLWKLHGWCCLSIWFFFAVVCFVCILEIAPHWPGGTSYFGNWPVGLSTFITAIVTLWISCMMRGCATWMICWT